MIMPISIGAATALRVVSDFAFTPDDRQTRAEIIGGIHVQDLGVVDEGEIIACQVVLDQANWDLVRGYWHNRTLVDVIDRAGRTYPARRVVVRKYQYVDKHPRYYQADLEFWAK